MGFKPITQEDLIYRLNKLKCCFATKAAEVTDKQRLGKLCKDEMCNLKLLGAYIEMIECYAPIPCDCYDEWVTDGELYWDETTPFTTGQVVKIFPRPNANIGEFLYLRWQNALPQPSGTNCFDPVLGWAPCWSGTYGITPGAWSVCGNLKVAWEARGSLIWNDALTYDIGDIVKFMGGGPGAIQTGRGKYYIAASSPTTTGSGFFESGHWVELQCFNEPA